MSARNLKICVIAAGLLAQIACDPPEPVEQGPPQPPLQEQEPGALSAAEVLTRASLDLRGQRPSEADLRQVEVNPSALDGLIDGYLQDEAFGSRVRDIFAVSWRTRFEFYYLPGVEYGVDPQYQTSVAEEPLKLLEHIAVHDLPYTKVIDADYTFVNEDLARLWPVRGYREDKGGWQKVHYRDERPKAGVLSMNALYFRYVTNETNINRGRANAISRILLCDNYLLRPIDFPRNIDLTDEEGIANAIEENEACTSCHATLDPIASYLFGFANEQDGDPYPVYDVGAAEDWRFFTNKAPAFYGQPGEDLADLGRQIAADPRFAACATQRLYEGLMGRPAAAADRAALDAHTAAFKDGGLTIRALVRSILSDPAYRGGDDGVRPPIERKIMSPEVLDDAVFALTGYRMTSDGINMLRSDTYGVHVLGGGLSGASGDAPPSSPNATRTLVQSRVAEAAAWALVNELPDRAEGVFGAVDLDGEDPDPAAFVRLHRAILGLSLGADDPEIVESAALWRDLVERGELSPREAWAGMLSVLLRDPRFVMY